MLHGVFALNDDQPKLLKTKKNQLVLKRQMLDVVDKQSHSSRSNAGIEMGTLRNSAHLTKRVESVRSSKQQKRIQTINPLPT